MGGTCEKNKCFANLQCNGFTYLRNKSPELKVLHPDAPRVYVSFHFPPGVTDPETPSTVNCPYQPPLNGGTRDWDETMKDADKLKRIIQECKKKVVEQHGNTLETAWTW